MHIPENYLSPATCAVFTAVMVPVWAKTSNTVKNVMVRERIPLLGAAAAFSFLGMMFNVPLIGGTTGHAVGGTLIALLFGPDAACIAVSIALLLQALLFGDGGVLSFGANCFNMAFVLPFTGYAVYKIIKRMLKNENAAAFIGAYAGLNAAALMAALEFGVQPYFFKDAAGYPLYCPYNLSVSVPAMMVPHLLVAGFVEAVYTVAVFSYVRKMAPGFVHSEKGKNTPVYVLIAVLIAAVPLGLLASGTAWGEWGAEEIAEVVTDGKVLGFVPKGILNGWSLESLMPDYTLEGMGEIPAYILSAVIGVALLIIIFKLSVMFLKKETV